MMGFMMGVLLRRDIEFILLLLTCAQNKSILARNEVATTYKPRE